MIKLSTYTLSRGLFLTLVLGAFLLAGAGCTYRADLGEGSRGRVVIRADFPSKQGALRRLPAEKVPEAEAQAARGWEVSGPRALSATKDISSMTVTVINLNDSSDFLEEPLDPNYPWVDLYLTPGESYRVVIDVVITDQAPGYVSGVRGYGDQAEFWVDPYWDTYVDLNIHPTKALVFHHQIEPTAKTVQVWDPTAASGAGAFAAKSFKGTFTADPADRFFYSSLGQLYYFNKTANKVYWWKDVSQALDPNADLVLSGSDTALAMDIYAVSEDPNYENSLFVVGSSQADSSWFYAQVAIDPSTKEITVTPGPDITADLEYYDPDRYGLSGAAVIPVPTSIAADTLGDVYIGYRRLLDDGTDTWASSGLLEYYNGSYYTDYNWPIDTPDDGIVTDVMFTRDRLFVLTSPNTVYGTATSQYYGTADLMEFNDYLEILSDSFPSSHSVTYEIAPDPSADKDLLRLPHKFAGLPQGQDLYFTQGDFLQSAPSHTLSVLDLDTYSVKDL